MEGIGDTELGMELELEQTQEQAQKDRGMFGGSYNNRIEDASR